MKSTWELTEYQKEIDLYLRSAVRLYGHIPPKKFLQIFNRFHKDHKLYKADLEKWAQKLNRQAKTYKVYTNAIINTTVPEEEIELTIYFQQGKPFFIPQSEEAFVKWASPYYYPETDQSKALKSYLITVCKVPFLMTQALMIELTQSIMEDQRMQCQADILDKYNAMRLLSFKQAQDFVALQTDFFNNTIHWANCGYTPYEMQKLQESQNN